MTVPPLAVHDRLGMTCVGVEGRPRNASFAFVGRTGGVSVGDFSTLNVDGRTGDDPACVNENRRRALAAIGVGEDISPSCVIVPHQVHGTDVVCVNASDADTLRTARERAERGADAVIVTVANVAVLMAFADCVPVVLVAPGGLAVVHSGWRGTLRRVSALAARQLADAVRCEPSCLWAYVGPHIGAASYEVSADLAAAFFAEFGHGVACGERHLDLGAAVTAALVDEGVREDAIVDCGIDTASCTDGWYSHRASGGKTGRHAAVACLCR